MFFPLYIATFSIYSKNIVCVVLYHMRTQLSGNSTCMCSVYRYLMHLGYDPDGGTWMVGKSMSRYSKRFVVRKDFQIWWDPISFQIMSTVSPTVFG